MLISGTRSTIRLVPRSQPNLLDCTLTVVQGLGTSKDSDARDYFSNMGKHMIPFATTQEGDRELIELAFSKKKADERKEWLRQFRVCSSSFRLLGRIFMKIISPEHTSTIT